MGLDMVTKGVHNVIEFLSDDSPDMDVIGISDNFFSDINKPAAVNYIEGHGSSLGRFKSHASNMVFDEHNENIHPSSEGDVGLAASPGPSVLGDKVNEECAAANPPEISDAQNNQTAEPSATDGNKKKRSAPGSSASVEARTGNEFDEPPKKKKKKEKKKKKMTVQERSEPSRDVGWGRELVALDSYNRNVAAQTSVELDDSPSVPLVRKKKSSREGDAPTSVEKSPPSAPSATRVAVRPRREVKSNSRTM
ncbi:hypothetical protein F2Q68_00043401 [Brassica cretica]|uniref:Uncharacterized protein n=1 Tax=Brassica cretica TaxID=69181 RepID=A0A8S9LUW4_BRACR|nr:hypothetical protein F2Q68_00043401 [Brassica cretica]